MKRHIITLLFLLCALVLYAAGLALPATALIILGLITEGIFWFRLFGHAHRGKPRTK